MHFLKLFRTLTLISLEIIHYLSHFFDHSRRKDLNGLILYVSRAYLIWEKFDKNRKSITI